MAVKNFMARGNSKLSRTILCWNITPIVSCPNCTDCKNTCYAIGSYYRFPDCKIAWDRNFELSKSGQFVPYVIGQISRSRTVKAVRIHVSGDFFSREYILQWYHIAKMFPHIPFYGYTKTFMVFPVELEKLCSLPNVNIIDSIAIDGGLNYGDEKRIAELKAMGYHVCKGTPDVFKCGRECSYCFKGKKPCFPIH
jgi:hypothetical protein